MISPSWGGAVDAANDARAGADDRRLSGFHARYGKRALDVVVSAVLLVTLSPVFLATAIVVLWGDGFPLIFRQDRAGLNLRPFVIVKFRTMRRDANECAGSWKRSDPNWNGRNTDGQGMERDPRIIRGGNFLRKRSFDEIPQLWNVLRGDMSLVGPRPLLCNQVTENVGTMGYQLKRRSVVRPGITGLWQVSGRSNISFEGMLVLDMEYIDSLSFQKDLLILFKTVGVVLRPSGAA